MKAPTRRRPDPLVRDLARIMKPILGRSAEKADLLLEHMAKGRRRKLDLEARGLADAARRLRATFTDDEIREAARTLVAQLAAAHGRDTVA